MKKYIVPFMLLFALSVPGLAVAAPQDDAAAVVQKFLDNFSAGKNPEDVVGLFAPTAVFWGTTMTDVGSTTDAIRQYFTANFTGRPAGSTTKAKAETTQVFPISDSALLFAGRWQVDRMMAGAPDAITELRYTFVIVKQGNDWKIAHLHSSAEPVPAVPAPAPAK